MATKKRKKHARQARASARAQLFMALLTLAFIGLMAIILINGGENDTPDGALAPGAVTPAPTQSAYVDALAPTEPPAQPTAAPTPTPTPAPTPVPLKYQTITDIHADGDTRLNGLKVDVKVYMETKQVDSYSREDEIHMGDSADYTILDGITTFRGNNYRDSASFGVIPNDPTKLTVVWKKSVGHIKDSDGNKWTGVGWTGQASVVRWQDEVKNIMNINADKKSKANLTEVICAALDGKIYFLDLDDGEATRNPIRIGAPIKGSLSIDPRGYPLLYVGQGIYKLESTTVHCYTRVYNLINQKEIFHINGRDETSIRKWYAFDCSPLVDGASDTMFQLGENGILYSVKLNTDFSPAEGEIKVSPETVRYVYNHNLKGQLGSENSLAVYNNYGYFVNNSGLLQCVDLNTLTLKWAFDVGDDTDATCAIEIEDSGLVALYTASELDISGNKGNCHMRKFNALTGEELWCVPAYIVTNSSSVDGGAFASPAIGKGELNGIVYFHLARTEDGGTLLALDKATGDAVWTKDLGKYGWSSPVCCLSENGVGYVIVCSSDGTMRLLKGLSGEQVASINLTQNIESSPVVFDDMIVVSTRGGAIHGVRIQ